MRGSPDAESRQEPIRAQDESRWRELEDEIENNSHQRPWTRQWKSCLPLRPDRVSTLVRSSFVGLELKNFEGDRVMSTGRAFRHPRQCHVKSRGDNGASSAHQTQESKMEEFTVGYAPRELSHRRLTPKGSHSPQPIVSLRGDGMKKGSVQQPSSQPPLSRSRGRSSTRLNRGRQLRCNHAPSRSAQWRAKVGQRSRVKADAGKESSPSSNSSRRECANEDRGLYFFVELKTSDLSSVAPSPRPFLSFEDDDGDNDACDMRTSSKAGDLHSDGIHATGIALDAELPTGEDSNERTNVQHRSSFSLERRSLRPRVTEIAHRVRPRPPKGKLTAAADAAATTSTSTSGAKTFSSLKKSKCAANYDHVVGEPPVVSQTFQTERGELEVKQTVLEPNIASQRVSEMKTRTADDESTSSSLCKKRMIRRFGRKNMKLSASVKISQGQMFPEGKAFCKKSCTKFGTGKRKLDVAGEPTCSTVSVSDYYDDDIMEKNTSTEGQKSSEDCSRNDHEGINSEVFSHIIETLCSDTRCLQLTSLETNHSGSCSSSPATAGVDGSELVENVSTGLLLCRSTQGKMPEIVTSADGDTGFPDPGCSSSTNLDLNLAGGKELGGRAVCTDSVLGGNAKDEACQTDLSQAEVTAGATTNCHGRRQPPELYKLSQDHTYHSTEPSVLEGHPTFTGRTQTTSSSTRSPNGVACAGDKTSLLFVGTTDCFSVGNPPEDAQSTDDMGRTDGAGGAMDLNVISESSEPNNNTSSAGKVNEVVEATIKLQQSQEGLPTVDSDVLMETSGPEESTTNTTDTSTVAESTPDARTAAGAAMGMTDETSTAEYDQTCGLSVPVDANSDVPDSCEEKMMMDSSENAKTSLVFPEKSLGPLNTSAAAAAAASVPVEDASSKDIGFPSTSEEHTVDIPNVSRCDSSLDVFTLNGKQLKENDIHGRTAGSFVGWAISAEDVSKNQITPVVGTEDTPTPQQETCSEPKPEQTPCVSHRVEPREKPDDGRIASNNVSALETVSLEIREGGSLLGSHQESDQVTSPYSGSHTSEVRKDESVETDFQDEEDLICSRSNDPCASVKNAPKSRQAVRLEMSKASLRETPVQREWGLSLRPVPVKRKLFQTCKPEKKKKARRTASCHNVQRYQCVGNGIHGAVPHPEGTMFSNSQFTFAQQQGFPANLSGGSGIALPKAYTPRKNTSRPRTVTCTSPAQVNSVQGASGKAMGVSGAAAVAADQVSIISGDASSCHRNAVGLGARRKRKMTSAAAHVTKLKPGITVIEGEEEVDEIEPDLGRLVWARLAFERWWPAIVIKGSMVHLCDENPTLPSSWVFWFGDHKFSLVPRSKIVPFIENFKSHWSGGKGKLFNLAVQEILQVCWSRGAEGRACTSLLEWAHRGFPLERPHSFEPPPDEPVPASVMEHLHRFGKEILDKAAAMDPPSKPLCKESSAESVVDDLWSGKANLSEVCIVCCAKGKEVMCEHPLFLGGVCGNCKNSLLETMFVVGEDGNLAFCAICTNGGNLFICDSSTCHRVFCFTCVAEFVGEKAVEQIQRSKQWLCFVCAPWEKESHGLLQPHRDVPERVLTFHNAGLTVKVPDLSLFKMRRPLRVLSLFDGMGSGLLALDAVGVEVEQYFASEVDADAIIVAQVRHGNRITQLGDITSIDAAKVKSLVPIDLVMGGSPCNQLSLCNPARRGFHWDGSGALFFEFTRVLELVQMHNAEHHLFWLFENVASMQMEYRATISRFLGCQPALWDAKHFVPQQRARFFWGNIPGIYSTPAQCPSLQTMAVVGLESVLERNCGREATVGMLRTVTTNSNSLRLGPHHSHLPVSMAGQGDVMWITELERLFGFPPHYTDVCNMSSTRRQKLIGKAWCIPVVKRILDPLRQYFACKAGKDPL